MSSMIKHLVWKEYRQQRWFLAVGVPAALIFVLYDLYHRYNRDHTWQTSVGSGIVIAFGAIFALILAVGTTWDDLRPRQLEFWKSRPVGPGRLLGTKFLLGIVLLVAGFLLIQTADLITRYNITSGDREIPIMIILYNYPIAILLFGVGMLLTTILRDPVKAAFLTLWFGLLVYFVPWISNAFPWMSFLDLVIASIGPTGIAKLPYVEFLTFTLGGAAVCLWLSIRAVRNQWRWDAGQKTIVWLLGLTGALIFAAVMLQTGSNLKSLRVWHGKPVDPTVKFFATNVPIEDWADAKTAGAPLTGRPSWTGSRRICAQGDYLYLASTVWDNPPDVRAGLLPGREDLVLDVYQSPTVTGRGEHTAQIRFYAVPWKNPVWHNCILQCHVRRNRLYVVYQPGYQEQTTDGKIFSQSTVRMLTADLSRPGYPKRVSDVELVPLARARWTQASGAAFGTEYAYVLLQSKLLVLSLADPDRPRIVESLSAAQLLGDKVDHLPGGDPVVIGDRLLCPWRQGVLIMDMADPRHPRKLLSQTLVTEKDSLWYLVQTALLDGDILYVGRIARIDVYRLRPESNGTLTMEQMGTRRSSPLERMAGMDAQEFRIAGKYLYEAAGRFGLLVFDVSNPARPRRVFHASQQDAYWIGEWGGVPCMADPVHSWGEATLLERPPQR